MKNSVTSATEWTIDELAADSNAPTRTIREYQRLGLLPAPKRVGRTGRYGPEHRARLGIISRLQERGYSLAAIGDLMGSWELGRGLGSVLGVNANPAVLDEAPTKLNNEAWIDLVPAFSDPELVNLTLAAGLLHRIDDQLVARSTAVLELIGLAIEAGMPADAAVSMAKSVRNSAAETAKSVIEAFGSHLWPRNQDIDLGSVMSRARLLLAQASASYVVHELGEELYGLAAADESGDLAKLVDEVAIGWMREIATPQAEVRVST